MQFVSDGPDIPDSLLQAHEEGNVVFFCGAGISYPAGLPDFKGLVEKIYELNGAEPSDLESQVLKRGQYDLTLDLLERRIPGHRSTVRRILEQVLQPDLQLEFATTTHESLLELAQARDSNIRLVTTNFDRLFDHAANKINKKHKNYSAPMLPVPKNSRWNGVVYLHGQLPECVGSSDLNHLVITSGDFGLAYLTERWASRFVSELFRNYVVCFVGYSINDPVLRYMMDALAADRMLGELTPQAWALGECTDENKLEKKSEWEAKGVTPILYKISSGDKNHTVLHETLKAWSETYRDGVLGKERIVLNHGLTKPSASTYEDDFVGRMLWALSDDSGLPVKRFALLNPVPSLDWLFDVFANNKAFNKNAHDKNSRHKSISNDLVGSKKSVFYTRWNKVGLLSASCAEYYSDTFVQHMSNWLLRHLGDHRLLLWVAESGGVINSGWSQAIEAQLNYLYDLGQDDNKHQDVVKLLTNSPKAIPSAPLMYLWRLAIHGLLKSPSNDLSLYRWGDKFKSYGLTTLLRLELRDALSIKIKLMRPYRLSDDELNEESQDINKLIRVEIELASDNAKRYLPSIEDPEWFDALSGLIFDFQQLLIDGLSILRELGVWEGDRSFWDLPSIEEHSQNRGYNNWVFLIELIRDAWLSCLAKDRRHASDIAQSWFHLPYPVFKRLALFAASRHSEITSAQWVNWLLADDSACLWGGDTRREMFRLLVLKGNEITDSEKYKLEQEILKGPPANENDDEILGESRYAYISHAIWLRLGKLQSSGISLGDAALNKFNELSTLHPMWKLADNERDEFSHWMSEAGYGDFRENLHTDDIPRTWRGLMGWLMDNSTGDYPFYFDDGWGEICRSRFYHAYLALYHLAKEDKWPERRWREAFQIWSETGSTIRSWKYILPLITCMPEPVIKNVVHALVRWLRSVSKLDVKNKSSIIEIAHMIVNLSVEPSATIMRNGVPIDNPVHSAINHPVGEMTTILLDLWFEQNLKDGELIPKHFKDFFIVLCNNSNLDCIHGRVLLSSRIVTLFRVDCAWTKEYLIPFFDWSDANEARSMWDGFLWSPRLHHPLMCELKDSFSQCFRFFGYFGDSKQQLVYFTTYAALDDIDGYSDCFFRKMFLDIPEEGLKYSADALCQALDSSGVHKDTYWDNRVEPFLKNVWPKKNNLISPETSESLALLMISADNKFPIAVELMRSWLIPIEHLHYVIYSLANTTLCASFPRESLLLMSLIVDDQPWIPVELGECLDKIQAMDGVLAEDNNFKRLKQKFMMARG